MPADFPAFAMGGFSEDEQCIQLSENEPKTLELENGQKIHIVIKNPATLKPAKAPVSFDDLERRNMLWAALCFILLAICLAFTFFASI
jgi:hypothetical protein